jgi:protein-S-isoprenylcysteine O-methyltransferase Ste14
MPSWLALQSVVHAARRKILRYDNQLLGLVLLAIAVSDWRTLWRKYHEFEPYIALGFYATPAIGLLLIGSTAVYVTSAALILLTARQPLARYETLAPNLLAVLAAFSVYFFVFLPPAETRVVPVFVALSVMAAGGVIVLLALVYLRRAFTVTPQARHLVNFGPYAIVRHPMYIGNIVTMLGLAFLIGTVPALLLFVLTAALQVLRGLMEDWLLERSLPGYRDYMRSVGGFVPKWPLRAVSPVVVAGICLVLPLGHSLVRQVHGDTIRLAFVGPLPAAPVARARSDLPIVRVQAGNMADRCQAWQAKALSGSWVTRQEAKEFQGTEDNQESLERIPACHAFFALQEKCQEIYFAFASNEVKAAAALNRIDATPGCRSIVGFTSICELLKELPKASLSASGRTMASECLDESLVASRAEFMREGM